MVNSFRRYRESARSRAQEWKIDNEPVLEGPAKRLSHSKIANLESRRCRQRESNLL
jgi:hypothetical protein